MSFDNEDEKVRTTIRLSKHLHQRLRHAALDLGMTSEALAEMAISHELERRGFEGPAVPDGWCPLLAQRFLECLPTPAVIKDLDARIIWCNPAYEDFLHCSRGSLLYERITDVGWLERESARRLKDDIKAMQHSPNGTAMEFWEPVTLPARDGTTTLFRTHRFIIRPGRGLGLGNFLGDVSFDWGQIRPGYPRDPAHDLAARLKKNAVPDRILGLFEPFLAACPAAVAVKDCATNLLWCNPEYEQLAGAKLSSLAGRSTANIFQLTDIDPIVQNEYTVVHSNVWMYAVESLPNREPRTSLRFPIAGVGGSVGFIGVLSAELGQGDVKHHKPFQRRHRAPGGTRSNTDRPPVSRSQPE